MYKHEVLVTLMTQLPQSAEQLNRDVKDTLGKWRVNARAQWFNVPAPEETDART